ncbi:hypothetical protein LUZ62_064064 [Rhynchospora pubera]|uniref:Uncharacterized protein n=1 Tax=Rhynchospora pubera TaxID=906938 RepID=A0AAV8ENX3_9POAL|nr:hypothetical protein LUZ62_064064 [Rhynchospora pubera]
MESAATAGTEKKKKDDNMINKDEEAIPTESSPYVRYTDLEEYKTKAYGSPGHLPVIDRPHHGGATDAPTLSGNATTINALPNHPPQSPQQYKS